jgi:hypothetical protein
MVPIIEVKMTKKEKTSLDQGIMTSAEVYINQFFSGAEEFLEKQRYSLKILVLLVILVLVFILPLWLLQSRLLLNHTKMSCSLDMRRKS